MLGIAYGMYHQRSLTTRHHSEKAERDYAHRESLIRRAKAEYTKKSLPDHLKQPAGGAGSGGMKASFYFSMELLVGMDWIGWDGWEMSGVEWYERLLTSDFCTRAVITDPDDARFDLEAYLKMKEVEWS